MMKYKNTKIHLMTYLKNHKKKTTMVLNLTSEFHSKVNPRLLSDVFFIAYLHRYKKLDYRVQKTMQFSFIDNYCHIHLHGENLIQEENMPKLPLINVPIKVTCTNSNIYMHPV